MQVTGVKVDWHLLFKIITINDIVTIIQNILFDCFLCIFVCLYSKSCCRLFCLLLCGLKYLCTDLSIHCCFRCCCLLALVLFTRFVCEPLNFKRFVYKPLHCQTAALEPECARPVPRGGRCHLDPLQLQSGGHDGETGKCVKS